MDWSPLSNQYGDFRQPPQAQHQNRRQDQPEPLGQHRKEEVHTQHLQPIQPHRQVPNLFQPDGQQLIRGTTQTPHPSPHPPHLGQHQHQHPTPTATTPQGLTSFTSAGDSIMQTTTSSQTGLLSTPHMMSTSAPHLVPSPTSHLLPNALPQLGGPSAAQMGHVPFYQDQNLPPIRSQQTYQNGYAIPPASPYMLMVSQPQNLVAPRPPTAMPTTQEPDPVHVVGQQGRRGILPSAPGCSPSVSTKALVPRKDENGKFVCPACVKSYQHLKHLKRHLLRHTGERPYMCPLCKDSFSRSDILKRHYQKCSHRRGVDPGGDHLEGTRNKKHRTGVTLATSSESSLGSTFGASGQESENNVGGGPVGGYFPWTTF